MKYIVTMRDFVDLQQRQRLSMPKSLPMLRVQATLSGYLSKLNDHKEIQPCQKHTKTHASSANS